MPTFSDTKSSATPEELDSLEKYAEVVFPNEYRNHLLKDNGGQCTPSVFHFSENGKVTSSCIDRFLPTHKETWGSLKDYIETYKIDEKRLPNNLIPVAFDPGGNLICLSCFGSDAGSVYFWDHENEVDYSETDDSDTTNLYLIANSFSVFLASLTEED